MEQTVNTFQEGLLLDTHPIVQGNKTLSDALNATFITQTGNEVVLQNEMGNRKIISKNGTHVSLEENYVPVGIKEYGGIIYIASFNPFTGKSLLGSFPSPDIVVTSDNTNTLKLDFNFSVDSEGYIESSFKLYISDLLVRKGDKYVFYEESQSGIYPMFGFLKQYIKNLGLNPIFEIKPGVIVSNEFVELEELEEETYFIKKGEDVSTTISNLDEYYKSNLTPYLNKFNGNLALRIYLTLPETFNPNIQIEKITDTQVRIYITDDNPNFKVFIDETEISLESENYIDVEPEENTFLLQIKPFINIPIFDEHYNISWQEGYVRELEYERIIDISKIASGQAEINKWKYLYNGNGDSSLTCSFYVYPHQDATDGKITISFKDKNGSFVGNSIEINGNLEQELLFSLTNFGHREVYKADIVYSYKKNSISLTFNVGLRWILTTSLLNEFYNINSVKDYGNNNNEAFLSKLNPKIILTITEDSSSDFNVSKIPVYYTTNTSAEYFEEEITNVTSFNLNFEPEILNKELYPEGFLTLSEGTKTLEIINPEIINNIRYLKTDDELIEPNFENISNAYIDSLNTHKVVFEFKQIYRNYCSLESPQVKYVYTSFYDFLKNLIASASSPYGGIMISASNPIHLSVGIDNSFNTLGSDNVLNFTRWNPYPHEFIDSLTSRTTYIYSLGLNSENESIFRRYLLANTTSTVLIKRIDFSYCETVEDNNYYKYEYGLEKACYFCWIKLNNELVLVDIFPSTSGFSDNELNLIIGNIQWRLLNRGYNLIFYSYDNSSANMPVGMFKTNTDLYTLNTSILIKYTVNTSIQNLGVSLDNWYLNIFTISSNLNISTSTDYTKNLDLSDKFFSDISEYRLVDKIPAVIKTIVNDSVQFEYLDINRNPIDPNYIYEKYQGGFKKSVRVNERKLYLDHSSYIPSNCDYITTWSYSDTSPGIFTQLSIAWNTYYALDLAGIKVLKQAEEKIKEDWNSNGN